MFTVGAGYNTHTLFSSKIYIRAVIATDNFLKTSP